jgi:hypothetical protein
MFPRLVFSRPSGERPPSEPEGPAWRTKRPLGRHLASADTLPRDWVESCRDWPVYGLRQLVWRETDERRIHRNRIENLHIAGVVR